jgi:hypothetical protein
VFRGGLSGVPQAHLLYNEIGKYNFDDSELHFVFSSSLCIISTGFIFSVSHQ